MIFTPLNKLLAAALLLLPSTVFAACTTNEPNWLQNYDGTIGDNYKVRMTLVLAGDQVSGQYFYASQLRDIALKGTITNGIDIVLDELDAQGKTTARFEGKFAERDPKGRFGGSKLQCETIVGSWQKPGAGKSLPVYLSMESATSGALGHRYSAVDADDEVIHRQAYRFWDAVKRGDKKTVAAQIAYPIQVSLAGRKKPLRSPPELMANYDAIFTPRYRAAIVNAIPKNMFVRDQGIMLGSGEVWFRSDGKVIALNTYQ